MYKPSFKNILFSLLPVPYLLELYSYYDFSLSLWSLYSASFLLYCFFCERQIVMHLKPFYVTIRTWLVAC